MFSLINQVGGNMKEYIQRVGIDQESVIELKELCAKYTTDVIALCAFAIDSRCFKDEDPEFR